MTDDTHKALAEELAGLVGLMAGMISWHDEYGKDTPRGYETLIDQASDWHNELEDLADRVEALGNQRPDAWACRACGKVDWADTDEQLAKPEHVSHRGADIGRCPGVMVPLMALGKQTTSTSEEVQAPRCKHCGVEYEPHRHRTGFYGDECVDLVPDWCPGYEPDHSNPTCANCGHDREEHKGEGTMSPGCLHVLPDDPGDGKTRYYCTCPGYEGEDV